MIHFIQPLNFWIGLADSGNRYWNALGIGNPFNESAPIIAEFNPPKEGINRRISGVFLENESGNIFLAHRGKVGGGRKGIGKTAFMAWYNGPVEIIQDGVKTKTVLMIGRLDNPKLLNNLAKFTMAVSDFKHQIIATNQ